MMQRFSRISDQQESRDSSIYLADSLYSTFPYISTFDKYRYYDFKRDLFELIRYTDNSYDTAIIYADSMVYIIEDNKLQIEMRSEYLKAFTIRGDYYTRRQRYNDAINDINKCKQIYKLAGDSCEFAENSKTLAYIAIKQSDFSLAVQLLKEAISYLTFCKKDQQQFVRTQRYLDDLGFVYSNQKKYDSAILYHLKAIKYIYENKNLAGKDTIFPYIALENIYGNIGNEYLLQNKLFAAEQNMQKAIEIDRDILKDKRLLALEQYILSNVLLKQGKVQEADEMAQEAGKEINNFDLPNKHDFYDLQAQIAHAKNDYKDESKYLRLFLSVKDSIHRNRLELMRKNPFLEYERLDKKYQVDILKKDNINKQNKITAAIIIGGLLTFLAIMSIYLLLKLRNLLRKRAVIYNKLVASDLELKETMAQKEFAEKLLREKELFAQEIRLQMEFNEAIIQQRRQISDDMHDELSNSLAALKFYIGDVKNRSSHTAAAKDLSEIEAEVSTIYESARNYMHSLKTNNWETRFSLIGFLKDIKEKFSQKGLMSVALNIDENNIKQKLSTKQHDQFYHIVREAISNVIKHAGASRLLIAIEFKDDQFIFSIVDNGKGFDKNLVVYGIGTESLQKRIKDMEGELSINSSVNGVAINGFFPVF